MKKSVYELKYNKIAFDNSNYLIYLIKNSFCNNSNDEKEKLDFFIRQNNIYLLPSFRYGNAIALAFETGNYLSARYMIENASRLNLNLEKVSYDFDEINAYNLKEEYLFSLSFFEGSRLSYEMINSINDNSTSILGQISATKFIDDELNVTEEERKSVSNKTL